MTEETANKRILALIEAYGADARRWPVADRGLADHLPRFESDPSLADARALDRLLMLDETSRAATPADPALMARILEDTVPAAGTPTPASGSIRPLESARARRADIHREAGATGVGRDQRMPRFAAALMAACLALGIVVGSLPSAQTTVAEIGTLAGFDLATSTPMPGVDDVFWGQDDEDIL